MLGPQTYTLGNQFPGQHSELLIAPTVTNLTIAGAGEGKTVLDATNLGNRVLEISAGATVTLSNLTITGAHAPDGSPGGDR